jgi:putative membrane protein
MMDGFDMSSGGWITMVLVWMVLVLIVIWAVRLLRPVPGGEQPLEVLDRRLARGEIDAATYDQLRAKLTGTAPGPPGGPSSATR